MTSRPRTAWSWVVSTLLALVLYVLSIGPVCWVAWKLKVSGNAWQAILDVYLPLRWIAGKSDTAGQIIVWYVHLWVPNLFG